MGIAPLVAFALAVPASFSGNLPCADCAALRYHLDLFADGSYVLRRTYVGKAQGDHDVSGHWSQPGDAQILKLEGASEQFAIGANDALRLLDQSGQPIVSKLSYELSRDAKFAPVDSVLVLGKTRWTAVRIGTEAVSVADPARAPYLTFQPDSGRVAGSGGCNHFGGGYTLKGRALSFGALAGTLMACVQGMEWEGKFHQALQSAASWRIRAGTLQLADSHGTVLVELEPR